MYLRSQYIPTLDGWRAIAIAGVLVSHSFGPETFGAQGALGVQLFFALSGFLITYRMLAENGESGSISLREFYLRRAFRILPASLLFLATVALLAAIGVIAAPAKDIASAALFLRNYWGGGAATGWYTGHFWSLAVEEHFYLFWPALLVLAGIRRARWLAPALALAFALWRSLDSRYYWMSALFHNDGLRNSPVRTDYRMDGLLWGCALALLAAHVPFDKLIPKRLGSIVALAAIATAIAVDFYKLQSFMAFEALLFPIAIMATLAQPASLVSRVLDLAPMRWIGRLSYSLYLWQQLFFAHAHHGTVQMFPVNLALALGCAATSFYLVERPCIQLRRKFLAKPQVRETTTEEFTLSATA